jgi:predicted kinase
LSLGYTRKELGQLHRQFYEERMEKSTDKEAFQRALMSMVKGMIDLIDANNKKLEQDIQALIKSSEEKNV